MKTIRIFSLREKSWQPKKVREKNVRDYLILQAKLAYAQSMGDKPVKKKIEELNRLADIIKNKPTAMEYLQAYNTWQSKAGEIYQIIQNSMAEGMSILDQ